MKKSKYTEQQIMEALQLAASGMRVDEVCRKMGCSVWTFYQWRKRYSGVSVKETKRLRDLETENSKLKRLVASQAYDLFALKDTIAKKL